MNRVFLIILIIGAICLAQSCDEPERTYLTKDEKDLVDSIYSKKVSYTRKSADSLCDAQYQAIFDAAVDSFYQEYVREIEDILNGEG